MSNEGSQRERVGASFGQWANQSRGIKIKDIARKSLNTEDPTGSVEIVMIQSNDLSNKELKLSNQSQQECMQASVVVMDSNHQQVRSIQVNASGSPGKRSSHNTIEQDRIHSDIV